MVGKRKAGGVVCLFVFFVLALQTAWSKDQESKVAVLPFVMHGQIDAVKTQKLLYELFTRLGDRAGLKLIDPKLVEKVAGGAVSSQEQAQAVGRKLGAAYVMFGSYSQVGNTISIDAKLLDMSGVKKPVVLLAEQQGAENLALAVGKIVEQMSADVLTKSLIVGVRVKGNERIEAAAIKRVVKSKKGELFNPEQVSEDIRAIFKMGYFEKVEAEVTNTPAGKILTFVVKENPIVQKVVVKGNKKIKKKDILAAIGTRQYGVLRRSVVSNDVQKIRSLYQQKGYYNAKVSSKISFPKSPHRAVVTFNINEHKKVYIKSIKFVGNKHISSRKLRGVMQTKVKSILSLITERGVLQRDILNTDIDRLNAYYRSEGYMDARVGSPNIVLKKDGFHITIPVEEGQRYRIKSVKLTGDLIKGYKKDILKKFELKPKEYFSSEKLRHDIDLVKSVYTNRGYARVEIEPQVGRNPETHTTDIVLYVRKNGIVRIGRIFITGNTKTRDYVIRREMKISEGDIFSTKAIQDSLYALRKLDYFKDVQIVPVGTTQKNIMDLNVKVKEKQTGTISFGGGYSTEDGLFATGQIQQKNLYGKGEYLALQAFLGQDAQRYILSYTKPWLFGTPLSGGFDVYNWVRVYEDFTKDSYGFKLRAGYPLGRYSNLTGYYVWESAKIGDLDLAASKDPLFKHALAAGSQIKSGFGVAFERNTTDRPFLPTKGSYVGAALEYDTKYLGGDYNLFRQEYHVGYYYPLFWKFIGHVRGELGLEHGSGGLEGFPLFERFFLGGINSMRGWKFGYLGPHDSHGLVYGGNKYAVINTELLFPLLERYGVRGVLFFDTGNAFAEGQDIDISKFREDVGPGIRWNSPFGPLRIEMGYVLDKHKGEGAYQWQFSAGAFF